MVSIQVKITGLDKVNEAMRKYPAATARELNLAIQKTVKVVEAQAVKEAPVNKQTGGGNLRQNIRSQMTGALSGVIMSKAPYSAAVHEGTRPHEIRYSKPGRGGLFNARTGQGFGRVVQHPGTRPNPFMLRAIEHTKTTVEKIFETMLKRIFQ